MTDETTTEQLVEIEGQAADTPATEYTPPEGWRVVQFGEPLRGGDEYDSGLNRYIRRIESQQQPQPHPDPAPQPEPIQVCEGRWRTRHGAVKNIRPCEPLRGAYFVWPWTDGCMTFQDNGRHQGSQESPNDLVEYLGPIEEQPKPQPEPQREPDAELRIRLLQQANDSQAETIGRLQAAINERAELGGADQTRAELQARIRELEAIRDYQAGAIEELRSEVSYVQRLLGESRQRVTQLEELVASLRTINEAQEKAFAAAGKENTALRNQLAAVKAELANVAADRQQLRVELDAAQQVPADSPELRQLRLDLAEVTQDRDTYRHAHELLLNDVNATHQRTKVMTIEAIVEWLVPIRTCGSQALATAVISNLPHIMRHLTGLEDEGIE